MTALTPDDLARIEELAEKATPGPWEMTTQGGIEQASYDGPGEVFDSIASVRDFDDWRFITSARSDVPLLVAGVRSRDARIAELEAVISEAWLALEGESVAFGTSETNLYRSQRDAARRTLYPYRAGADHE